MKFNLTDQSLVVTAETAAEVQELCEHFRLDATKRIENLVSGTMTQHVPAGDRPWFAQEQAVDFEFLSPYYNLLNRVTGYDGPAFLITDDRLRYPGSIRNPNLVHTHIVTSATIDAVGYHAVGFIRSQDWNGRTAAERAPRQFSEYLHEALGATKHEPEFIEVGNGGLLRRNPNYLRHHAPHAAATSVKLFDVLVEHWLEHHASQAQRDMWAEAERTYQTVCKRATLASMFMQKNRHEEFHVDNYKRTVTLTEFKELAHV